MKNLIKTYTLPFSIFAILLLPLLFTVISNDQSIFYKVARIMLDGGTLYHDCLDMKPPAIYIIFSVILFLFGKSPLSIIIFGYFWMLITSCVIYLFINKIFNNKLSSYISAIFFICVYLTIDWNNQLQLENIILLPLAAAIWIFLKKDKIALWNFIFGIIIGSIVSVKYTFIFIVVPFIIYDVIYHSFNFKRYLIYLISSLLAFVLWHFPLFNSDSYHGWRLYMDFLSVYSNYHPFSLFFLKELLGSYESVFLRFVSPFFVVFFVISFYYFVLDRFNSDTFKVRLYVLNSLIFITLFISVIIEKKFFLYHYSRLFLSASIFIGFGAYYFHQEILKKTLYTKAQVAFVLLLIFIISPVPKALLAFEPVVYKLFSSTKYIEYFGKYDYPSGRISEFYKIVDEMKKNDTLDIKKTMIIGISASMFNIILDDCEFSKFATPQFYLSDNSPIKWKLEALEEFKKADWIIAQNSTITPSQYGHWMTPYDALIADTILSYEINNNFKISFKTPDHTILERIRE